MQAMNDRPAETEFLRRIRILLGTPRVIRVRRRTRGGGSRGTWLNTVLARSVVTSMAEKSDPPTEERSHQANQEVSDEAAADRNVADEPSQGDRVSKAKSGGSDDGDDDRGDRSKPVGLKSITSLERLRDRVETAAHELKRLREENKALSERVKELEARPEVEPQGTFLSLDHDPEMLRRKVSGFIDAIDRYLESERSRS